MEYKRKENTDIPPLERIKNFAEFHIPLSAEQRLKQAARCMNCGVPFCQSAVELKGMVTGCPLHNLIPEFNDEIYSKHDHQALERLLKTNPFPEFTARVCPALCEKACLNGIDDESVTIKENEYYIIENAYEKGWMKPNIPSLRTDKKVAVIGSGPAGLTVAYVLNQRGHNVTVYERDDAPGGLLMYGIPNMKLEKKTIHRRIKLLKEEGITFNCNVNVGVDISKEELMNQYDAIVFAIGSKQPRALDLEDQNVEGIYYAVDYLSKMTQNLEQKKNYINAYNKNVVIVGGGDTGNDCVGTSIRQGCKSVIQVEMMPCPPQKRLPSNPWPEWPKILKTDYGQEEAIAKFKKDPRIYQKTIKDIVVEENKIKKVILSDVQFKDGKLKLIKGTEQEMDCDLLLIAAGFVGIEKYIKNSFELETTPRNTIKTDQYCTKENKIFAAGDCNRGQSLVVWAIQEGKECAKQVDLFLMEYSNLE